MKNFRKTLLLFAVVLVTAGMLFAMASCGGDGETPPTSNTQQSGTESTESSSTTGSSNDDVNPNRVKVTVVDENGNGIPNAYIQICQGESCFPKNIITGNDGSGYRDDFDVLDLNTTPLKARIVKINGFDDFIPSQLDEYVYFDAGSREITITLKKVTVYVVDDEANGINGAVVELYRGDYKFTSQIITDAAGAATGYVTVAEGDISAVVTEILSEGDYDISSKATEFESGEFECEIVVPKKIVYRVNVLTFFGEGMENVTVKLYNSKGILQDALTTDKDGVAAFKDMQKGEYYVTVSFVNPSYVSVVGDENGRCYFTNGSTELDITVSALSEIDYVVNVTGVTSGVVKLYDKNNIYVGEAEIASGKAVIKAPNGNYVAVLVAANVYADPIYFVKDGTAEGKIQATNKTPGTAKDCPVIVVDKLVVEISAGQVVYISVPNAYKKGVNIVGPVEVFYNNTRVSCELEFTEEKGAAAIFEIMSEVDAIAEISIVAPGTINQPIDVTDKITSDSYKAEEILEDTLYFVYTASKDGVLWVKSQYKVYFGIDAKDKEFVTDGDKILYPLTAGESVVIVVDAQGTAPSEKAEIEFGFGETKMDYTVYVSKDGIGAEGICVEIYLNGTLVNSLTTNSEGKVTFTGIDYRSDYTYKVTAPEGYENTLTDDSVGILSDIIVVLTKIKTGEVDAPFVFNTHSDDEKTAEADVKAQGVVWFTIYVNPGHSVKYTLSALSANAVITVYNADTNEDGIIDSADTPVGVSQVVNGKAVYAFTENGKQYTFAVSTADKNAENITLAYDSETLGQGVSYENPIDVSEGGSFTSTVNGTAYYRFASDEGRKITVTLNASGAKLQRVVLTQEGATATDVDSNTFVIEDTLGDTVFFAVYSEAEVEAVITVTVE